MRTATLIVTLIIFSFSGHAQVWGQQGAKWHYDFGLFSSGLTTVSYVSDTIVDGYSCQKLEEHWQQFYTLQNGTTFLGSEWTETRITRFSGDSVFYRGLDTFFLLYDFGASPGDVWTIYNDHGLDPYCDSLSKVQVIDVGTLTINSEVLRYVDLVHLQGAHGLSGRAVEKMGIVQGGNPEIAYLFPKPQNCDSMSIVDYWLYEFRCYSNDTFGEYNTAGQECDYLATHVGLKEQTTNYSVSPNPVKDRITVNAPNIGFADYKIYDYHGKVWKKGSAYVGFGINVAELPRGLYLLQLTYTGGEGACLRFSKE